MPRRRLTDGVTFERVTQGHYLPTEIASEFEDRCAAVLEAVPHAVLSHWTALRLHGLPVPPAADEDLHVVVERGRTEPRRRGVICHVVREPLRPDLVRGLAVFAPARSWCDAAAAGAALHDVVAAGDALWRRRPTAPQEIREMLVRRVGHRGVMAAWRALALLDRRSESPMESRLRVLLVLAGLPPTDVNADVRHCGTGAFLARVDLLYAEARVAVEYDGDHHRDRAQWQADLLRRERLEADGWCVVVVTARDVLGDPSTVVTRVRARVLARTPPPAPAVRAAGPRRPGP